MFSVVMNSYLSALPWGCAFGVCVYMSLLYPSLPRYTPAYPVGYFLGLWFCSFHLDILSVLN